MHIRSFGGGSRGIYLLSLVCKLSKLFPTSAFRGSSSHWEGSAVYRNSVRTNDASVHYPVTAPSCAAIVWASSFEVKSSLTVRMTALGGGGGGVETAAIAAPPYMMGRVMGRVTSHGAWSATMVKRPGAMHSATAPWLLYVLASLKDTCRGARREKLTLYHICGRGRW